MARIFWKEKAEYENFMPVMLSLIDLLRVG